MGEGFGSSCGWETSGLVTKNNEIQNFIYREIAEFTAEDLNGPRWIRLRNPSQDFNWVSPVKRFRLNSLVSTLRYFLPLPWAISPLIVTTACLNSRRRNSPGPETRQQSQAPNSCSRPAGIEIQRSTAYMIPDKPLLV